MAVVGNLSTSLTLESTSFIAGVGKVKKSVDTLDRSVSDGFGRINRSVSGMTNTMKSAAAGIAGALALGGIKAMIDSGLEYASSLAEVAQQLGVTTDTLQEYRYAATQVGISQAEMDAGLAKLTRSIGDAATGAKTQSAAFAALGVSVHDSNGALKTTDQVMPELVKALSAIEDPAKRAALEIDLFGKAGQKLDTLLAAGTEEVDNLKNAAHRLGVVLSSDQIARADQAADDLAAVKTVLSARIAGVVSDNADAIITLANALATLVDWTGKGIDGWKKFGAAMGHKIDAARGWTLTGGEVAGKEAAAARGRWKADQDEIDHPLRSWAQKMNAGIARGNWNRKPIVADRDDAPSTSIATHRPSIRRASSGAARSSGPSLRDETRAIMDALFPDAAQLRALEEKLSKLGKSLAAKLLSPADYERARNAITAEVAKLTPTLDGRLKDILADLYPEDAQIEKLTKRLADIDQALADKIGDPARWTDARARVIAELDKLKAEASARMPQETGGESFDSGWLAAARDASEAAKAGAEEHRQANARIMQSYATMAREVTSSLQSVGSALKDGDFLDIVGALADAAGQIYGGFQGLKGGGSVGFGGARAMGGPVSWGKAYLVGERGPELFMPRTSGSIVPNNALRGAPAGGGVTVLKLDLRGALMTEDVMRQMQTIANDSTQDGIAKFAKYQGRANRQTF